MGKVDRWGVEAGLLMPHKSAVSVQCPTNKSAMGLLGADRPSQSCETRSLHKPRTLGRVSENAVRAQSPVGIEISSTQRCTTC